jgi:hypothetical protein
MAQTNKRGKEREGKEKKLGIYIPHHQGLNLLSKPSVQDNKHLQGDTNERGRGSEFFKELTVRVAERRGGHFGSGSGKHALGQLQVPLSVGR